MFPESPRPPRSRLALVVIGVVLLGSDAARSQGAISERLFRGPYLQDTLATSTDIVWVSLGLDGPASVRAWLFPNSPETFVESDDLSCDTARDDMPTARCHRVRLEGLRPGARYSYQVIVGETALTPGVDSERVLTFRTPPGPGVGIVRFAAFGDSGIATKAQRLVGEVAASFEPDAILHTGDIDYLHDPDRSVFAPYRELLSGVPLYAARGNHDTEYAFEKFFTVPGSDPESLTPPGSFTYGGFDFGPVHIFVTDTTLDFGPGTAGERMVEFLRQDLADARERGIKWIIVTMHAPIFTVGPHAIDETLIPTRNALTPIFAEFEVDLVLSGDDHLYHRSHPLVVLPETCPDRAPDPCDDEPNIPLCYERRETDPGPHYADPEGTIYVVTGGGGNILYAGITSSEDGCRFVDNSITAKLEAQFHALDIVVSSSMIEVRAVDLVGRLIDLFSIQKIEGLPGDLNQSGQLDLGDAVSNLQDLFGGLRVSCPPLGEVDGSDSRDIGDAIYLLNYLFLGGSAPTQPFPDCGRLRSATHGFCLFDSPCP